MQTLRRRWHMMEQSNSASDSRNIRADTGSSKDTPEPVRKTFVAWPWEKAQREWAWVVAQRKLGSVTRESAIVLTPTVPRVTGGCVQSSQTNRSALKPPVHFLIRLFSKQKQPVGTLNVVFDPSGSKTVTRSVLIKRTFSSELILAFLACCKRF